MNMIKSLPEDVALKFQGKLRWLILVGAVFLVLMIVTGPMNQDEMPGLVNAVATAVFSFWFFYFADHILIK